MFFFKHLLSNFVTLACDNFDNSKSYQNILMKRYSIPFTYIHLHSEVEVELSHRNCLYYRDLNNIFFNENSDFLHKKQHIPVNFCNSSKPLAHCTGKYRNTIVVKENKKILSRTEFRTNSSNEN